MNANDLFPVDRYTEDGQEYGANQADLCRAVEIWFHARTYTVNGPTLTVGAAADAFNVTPGFLAQALDENASPYFFANPGPDPAARLLDCDGL